MITYRRYGSEEFIVEVADQEFKCFHYMVEVLVELEYLLRVHGTLG
jgi:hypothetical protein